MIRNLTPFRPTKPFANGGDDRTAINERFRASRDQSHIAPTSTHAFGADYIDLHYQSKPGNPSRQRTATSAFFAGAAEPRQGTEMWLGWGVGDGFGFEGCFRPEAVVGEMNLTTFSTDCLKRALEFPRPRASVRKMW